MTAVPRVDSVSCSLNKSRPPQLEIEAAGTVNTLGWSEPQLAIRVYVMPPADGMQEFDFVAQAPEGIVPQVLTPIQAEALMSEIPEWLRGVRVIAAANSMEARLDVGQA